jgi:glutamate-1-semialdehyde 2,1-aminomutase
MGRNVSEEIYQKACGVIPGGVNSPVRSFRRIGISPLIAAAGRGDLILDADGHSYIDYCCGWGSLIWGHTHPEIVAAASEQLKKGSCFGLMTEVEFQIAQIVTKHMPAIEQIRFVSSGTEATMSAIRLARGFTGRSLLVKFNGNYHGHADHLLIAAGSGVAHLNEASSKGVPKGAIEQTVSLPYNDTEKVRAFLRSRTDVAAVILEPIAANMGLIAATPEFLTMLREETERSGALLIFDEVVSGFRVGLSGVQGAVGIKPDLTCLGKVVGGGFPAAAFGGRADVMARLAPLGDVYQAGTLSGNPLAMVAGLKAIQMLEKPGFYADLEAKTRRLTDPLQDLPMLVVQIGSMFSFFFGIDQARSWEDLSGIDQNRFNTFFRHLFDQGIYISPSPYETCFVSAAHTEVHLAKTVEAIKSFFE